MEQLAGLTLLFAILGIVWSILCLILFFKVWGMTNDVRDIKEHILSMSFNTVDNSTIRNVNRSDENKTTSDFNIGDHVIDKKTGNEYIIHNINDEGNYVCKLPNSNSVIFAGTFSKEQLSRI